jgi:site-specific DNA recombinase
MICAIYGRKSTDDSDRNEEARSTTRQVARATEYAQVRGWTVGATFLDDGVSGATYAKLEGRTRLLGAAEAGAFQILVVSEQSRLGRDMIEVAYTIKRIAECGVRIFSYLDDAEIGVEGEQALLTMLRGYKDQGQRGDTSKRVYDAALRRVRAGQVAGAKVFGYDNVAITGVDGKRSHVERQVNASQAATVVRIFELYVGGLGSKKIAVMLNRDGVLSPRPRGWSQTTVRGILRNPIYRGEVVWGRIKSIVRRGKDHNQLRPEGQWIRQEQPALRIIDDALWGQVQARRERNRRNIPRTKTGRLLGRSTWHDGFSEYLVTGFGRCTRCGGSIRISHRVHGPKNNRHPVRLYACAIHDDLGAAKCANAVVLPHAVLDQAVLDAIVKVLHPAVLEAAVDRAFGQLQADRTTALGRRAQLERESVASQQRIDRLIDALADGTLPREAIRERLEAETARRMAVVAELGALDAEPIDAEALKRVLGAKVANVRELLANDVQQRRAVLRALLAAPMDCEGFHEGDRRGYRFKGSLTIDRLIEGEASLTGTIPAGRFVAGRGHARCGYGCRASGGV